MIDGNGVAMLVCSMMHDGPCAATRFHRVASFESLYFPQTTMPVLAFQQFSSLLHPTFWHALTGFKIDVLKLDDTEVPVTGGYGKGRTAFDKETGKDVGLGCTVAFEGAALEHRR
jgi:hypothetical protein